MDEHRAAVAAHLAGRAGDLQGWDRSPELWSVHLDGNGTVSTRKARIPDLVWAGGPPAAILALFSGGVQRAGGWPPATGIPGGGLHGAAFLYEGWSVPAGRPGTAEASEAFAAAMRRGIGDIPGRAEVRILVAVAADGATYQITRQRGGALRSAVWEPGRDGHLWVDGVRAGRARHPSAVIPDALDRIVAATCRVSLPARPRFWDAGAPEP